MDDYIKRDDVIAAFEKRCRFYRGKGFLVADFDKLFEEDKIVISKTPVADVRENVHGEWEIECEPDGQPYCLHCSVCDQEWEKIGIVSFYDFCPYCGADMRGDLRGNLRGDKDEK